MAEWIPNDMKVFGKEKDLGIFKNDIYEGKENILTYSQILQS